MKTPYVHFLFLAMLSCGGHSSSESIPIKQGGQDTGKTQVTDMHSHFDDINAIQLALISGNLVSARVLAKKIRIGFSGESPAGWEPYIERSVASAEMLEVAGDLAMAARIAGTMAQTCGDCHRAQRVVVVKQNSVAPPQEEDQFSNFMIQHRWAADRMWEGLIGPSDSAWVAGAQALANTELSAQDVGEHLIVTPEVESLLLQIRKDAVRAGTTDDPIERQKLYGSFLAGCASCHSTMMDQRD